jgi:hypothetical protein
MGQLEFENLVPALGSGRGHPACEKRHGDRERNARRQACAMEMLLRPHRSLLDSNVMRSAAIHAMACARLSPNPAGL